MITRKIISLNDAADTLDDEVREEHNYHFNKKGIMTKWIVRSYYDNICFEAVTLTFDDIKRTASGFCPLKKVEYEHYNGGANTTAFAEHKLVEGNEYFEIYEQKDHTKELMFMKDSAYWGSISIDTMLHPDPEDVIVLGSPLLPHRKFQVENTVKHFNVVEYEYAEGGVLKSMHEENYPFITKRNIWYGESGDCEGFVDSIFIDEKYLSRKEYRFRRDSTELPIELNRWITEGDTMIKIEQETFTYEFFERD